MDDIKVRLAMAGLLGALALATTATPAAQSATTTCRVRNVTQDTVGRSLGAMIRTARDGDLFRVRGFCEGGVIIRADVTIWGASDHRAVLWARAGRVVTVPPGITVVMGNIIIFHATKAAPEGGGIENTGTLTLIDAVVRGSTVWEGGIHNEGGTLTLVDTIVRDNTGGVGAGISLSGNHDRQVGGGSVTLIRSIVHHNTAEVEGGGIRNLDGSVMMIDSVIRDNSAGESGGGIMNEAGDATATLAMVRSTVSGNVGDGISNEGSIVMLVASVVSANTGAGISTQGGKVSLYDASSVTGNMSVGISSESGEVTLDATSSATGNTPDDCVGTTAC